jgi:hypothetical protein
MPNPFESPNLPSPGDDLEKARQTSSQSPGSGLWYLLLLPLSLLYILAAREFAGPGYTTAPDQGAMVVFFLASVAWPFLATFLVLVIRNAANIRGPSAACVGLISWIVSSAMPFLIGMK